MTRARRLTTFVLDRPILFGAVAVALTVAVARWLNYIFPRTHIPLLPGKLIHHYVFGIFILTIAGYLALLFKGPRATVAIALLYGLGVGLTFDEFGVWFNPPRVVMAGGARWHYSGIVVITSFFLLTAVLRHLAGRSASRSRRRPNEDGA